MADEAQTQTQTDEKKMFANLLSEMGENVDKLLLPDGEKPADSQASGALTEEEKAKAITDKAAADAAANQETAEQKATREAKEKEDKDRQDAANRAAQSAPVRPIVVQKKQPDQKADEDATAKKLREEDEAYVAGLTDDQKDELALARFAEAKGKPGLSKKVIDYYKKLDKFAVENPEAEPDGDDFKKFREENEPKLTSSERRRLEREMITEQATARAREEVSKEYEPIVREVNAVKSEKLVRKAMVDVGDELAKVIDPELVKSVLEAPYQPATKRKAEAEIVRGALIVTEEWIKIRNGAAAYDRNKASHKWIGDLLAYETHKMMSKPKAEQVKDGRQFIDLVQYEKIAAENPQQANAYYTFTDDEVVAMIARNGVENYQQRIKSLEEDGFVRPQPDKKTETPKVDAAAATTAASPKATGHISTGAGADTNKPAQFTGEAKLLGDFINTL